MTTTKERKVKLYKTADGQQVPANLLRKSDKVKDAATQRLFKKAEKIEALIKEFKNDVLSTGDQVNQLVRDDYQLKDRENSRGGYSMNTIDKSIKIEFKVGSRITFDDRIDMAKEKFSEYIDAATQSSDPELRQVINAAFETTKGKLDPARVMRLFSLKINHPIWKEAIAILQQSIDSQTTKRYVQFMKKDEEGRFINLILDFNAL